MKIQEIVEQALKNGYLTPIMESELGKICQGNAELSTEEYKALDDLMGALLGGEIKAMPQKQFINVMEDLVVGEVIGRLAEIEATSNYALDIGDIAAYALNRLPPLYATTEEGAQYQRERAKEELQDLINQQVEEGITRYLNQPAPHPERQAIGKQDQGNLFSQVNNLLKSYADEFEEN